MRKRIRNYIDNCVTCLIANSSTCVRKDALQITKPFEILHVDYFGPLVTSDEFKYVLVTVDAFSCLWFFPTRTTTSKEKFMSFLNVFGTPKKIVSDKEIGFSPHTSF